MDKRSARSLIRVVAVTVAATAAALAPLYSNAAPIDELNRFAGTWHSQGTFVENPYQKAGSATATTTCAWSIDHNFMICQQSVTMNGTPDSDLGIYSYDPVGNVYHFYNVRASRTTSSTILVDGNTITYPFSFNDNGKNVTIRTLNVWQSADAYTWRTEYSTDGGTTWALMASGKSERSP